MLIIDVLLNICVCDWNDSWQLSQGDFHLLLQLIWGYLKIYCGCFISVVSLHEGWEDSFISSSWMFNILCIFLGWSYKLLNECYLKFLLLQNSMDGWSCGSITSDFQLTPCLCHDFIFNFRCSSVQVVNLC